MVRWDLVEDEEQTILNNLVAFLLDVFPDEEQHVQRSGWYHGVQKIQVRPNFNKDKNRVLHQSILLATRKKIANSKSYFRTKDLGPFSSFIKEINNDNQG